LIPKANIVHLPVYQPGKSIEAVQKELGLSKVIKLASNENPFGCSSQAKEAILSEMDNLHIYPDGAAVDLRGALSAHLGVEPEQLIFGAGSDDVVLMLARAYLVPGDETIMASHTFPQYKHNAEIEGAACIEVPLFNGVHDLEGMLARITDKTKIVWICNPNNPTGTINTHEEVERFLERVPENVLVVLDEAYCEYVTTPDYPDSLSLLKRFKNLFLLRTFSKIYGLAALRVGYGIGHPEVVHSVNQVREPFNTSRMGQKAAIAALADQEFIARCRELNRQGIEYLCAEFSKMGLEFFPAYGNFVMVDVKRDAKLVFEALMRKGYIVRGGHQLGFPTKLRVTVGSREQNEGFILALNEVFQEVQEIEQSE